MSFLTSRPDLSGTIYVNQSLHELRAYLVSEITKVDVDWLTDPQGPLGDYWQRDDTLSTCYLLWIAWMVSSISNNISQRSVMRLQEKFKGLLRPSSSQQFTENLTELEVAWSLISRVSPLSIDPFVSEEAFSSGNRPTTPDFAFQLPKDQRSKEVVFVEVTVWHVGILDKWDKAVDQMTTTIQNRLIKQGRGIKLQVRLPLQEFDAKQILQMTNHAWNEIRLTDSGQLIVVDKGTIRWSPYPTTTIQESTSDPLVRLLGTSFTRPTPSFADGDIFIRVKALEGSSGFIQLTPEGVFHSSNMLVDRAFVREPDIAMLSEKDMQLANEPVVKSFVQKLKRKRVQFPHEEPYLLVIKPGHFRLLNNSRVDMLKQHIWTKRDYNWITGIVLFTSRQGFLHSEQGPQLLVAQNPHARCRASEALELVLDGKKKFHFD